MAIYNILNRQQIPSNTDAIARLQQLADEADQLRSDYPLRFTELALRRVRNLQENWSRQRSAAPFLKDEDPEVNALRERFFATAQRAEAQRQGF